MRLHPLARRILGSLGLGAVVVQSGVGCDEAILGCPEVTTREEEPIPGCKLTLSSEESTQEFCVVVPLDAGVCPSIDDPDVMAAAGSLTDVYIARVACGPLGPPGPGTGGGGGGGVGGDGVGGSAVGGGGAGGSAVGGGGVGGASGEGGGSGEQQGQCCYVGVEGQYCIGGRPFFVGGELRAAPTVARADWADPFPRCDDGLTSEARAALRDAWLRDAALEHASVASFARFVLELLAVGAPSELVVDAQRAMADEIAHARACFGLASRYAGEPLGPGALDLTGLAVETSLDAVVRSAIREGCIGETAAALGAARALEGATDPQVRAVLARIAEEEARHAELAWRFVAWALEHGGASMEVVVTGAIEDSLHAPSPPSPSRSGAISDALRAHGRLTSAEETEVVRVALEQVVAPCARALLQARDPGAPRPFPPETRDLSPPNLHGS